MAGPPRRKRPSPTWDQFKAAVRKVDRDSLLRLCAAATAVSAQRDVPEEWKSQGFADWTIADVARTSLAWGTFSRSRASEDDLRSLCHMNSLLVDHGLSEGPDKQEKLARVLARVFFEQFRSQRSVMDQFTRALLLFGAGRELPPGFEPEVMVDGWFESLCDGLTVEQYVESIFVIATGAATNAGKFSLEWMDQPQNEVLRQVVDFDAVSTVFEWHMTSTRAQFKESNTRWQRGVPEAERKYAFNPLTDRPFITDVDTEPLAPWGQAVIAKASAPGLYYFILSKLESVRARQFTGELGPIFQQYVGRQLRTVGEGCTVIPEVRYGPRTKLVDSCDWLVDLPDLLVLIECKSRQPIESLRRAGEDWTKSIADTAGKGIQQISRSDQNLEKIAIECALVDTAKPRVGIVVTLEPFYVDQNWIAREGLPNASIPTAVASVEDIETLVTLGAEELSVALWQAGDDARGNVMHLASALEHAKGRENRLLVETWESVDLFSRVEQVALELRLPPEPGQ